MVSSATLFFSASRVPVASSTASSESGLRNSNWWTPIVGWGSKPDYLIGGGSKHDSAVEESDPASNVVRPEKKLFMGCFTQEKAKALRKKTIETSNFHDRWNHSAIAARLASDVSA